jgi:two-component system phosphate regulon response regulator PhoB
VGARVLIVEDEPAIRNMVRFALVRAAFEVDEAPDAEQARGRILEQPPDLVLLDWMLPGVSGIDLARRLKKDPLTRHIPIVMLTARGEEEDRVRGLESGSDDYVVKPFSPRELVARIRAVLRRSMPHRGEEVVEVQGLEVDQAAQRVTAGDEEIRLGRTEFRLLQFLITHPERVHSRGQLLDRVWGPHVVVEERTVDVHVLRLRKALAGHGYDRLIQTVRGAGYRFSARSDER